MIFYPIFNKWFGHLETLLTINRPKIFVSWVTVRAFSAKSPFYTPKKDPHVTQRVSCFSFKYVIIVT